MRTWSLLFLTACGSTATHPTAPTPACRASVQDGKILVGGVERGIVAPPVRGTPATSAVAYPHGPHEVLVAWSVEDEGFAGSHDLYAVDCAGSAPATVFLHLDDADFGDSALAPDGKTLYFTEPGGVRALDLATKRATTILAPPMIKGCSDEEHPAIDVVLAFDPVRDTLRIERMGTCRVTGNVGHTSWYIDHPGTHPSARAARPVTAIAVDFAGTWWAATGDAIWSSPDRGAHWTRTTFDGAYETVVDVIAPDPKQAGALVVGTKERVVMGAPFFGGELFQTRDAGKTWTLVKLPNALDTSDPGTPHSETDLAFAAADVDHLVVDTVNQLTGNSHLRWATEDGGKHWASSTAPVPPHARDAQAGSTKLAPSPDGLLVDGVRQYVQ